ncbi:alpha/beta fold hydrolase [Roseobacter sp. YSTF-M11]|uniref:Alpha/beta fold hydrolase n=2 Tax=Roseobacter insulae TaxID=2859783 RepID=A0A9X1K0S7_9RHOB|nr:alpha/beta fold hydrolase [Roseobacter insulae]
MIFVHGYNNSFIESIYRYAQIAHDTDLPAAAIQFSWASAGEPSAYLADRDSALISRYALAEVIDAVSAEIPGRLVLVGHSMGALPLMEALTLLDEVAQARLAARVLEIVLVSPDLDSDLFATQLGRTSLPPARFAVAINRDDRLLGLSSFLSGGRERVGNKPDAAALSALGVRVLDISGVSDGDGPGHFLPATSPTLLEVFRTRAPS